MAEIEFGDQIAKPLATLAETCQSAENYLKKTPSPPSPLTGSHQGSYSCLQPGACTLLTACLRTAYRHQARVENRSDRRVERRYSAGITDPTSSHFLSKVDRIDFQGHLRYG